MLAYADVSVVDGYGMAPLRELVADGMAPRSSVCGLKILVYAA